MIPVLFEIGPLKVYSYGLMLGIAFLVGSYFVSLEVRRKFEGKIDGGRLASTITIIAIVFGIVGAKILFLIEHWDMFLRDPVGEAFSPGGLTWYGGFVLAIAVLVFHLRRRKIPILKVLDTLSLALMIGYGVGRLGCHFSGDGDYGFPTSLPWGTIYKEGTAKPSVHLGDYFARRPDERAAWSYDSLRVIRGGIDRRGFPYTKFDEVTPLHPAPVYELMLGLGGFVILWVLRTRVRPDGMLFATYLMLAAVFRFGIEFIRLNPKIALGMTEAQLIGIAVFLTGLIGALVLFTQARRRSTVKSR